ncbi:putative cell division control protein [Trypanosoma rangeli]|uniref:Putative cell division control protein n=1 Tax=Trypanosoma rangeli TaxID=5698 RepID=A0A3R7N5A2_TRYRA|nr:putative cell division control protein [Trypanosoma rangeli]RNF00449.1 putative cell division control protein [Trypanosoma rangeli]|eukprot:RNF00449.1 putative cell division control protein [Trypanosoma rangeli]
MSRIRFKGGAWTNSEDEVLRASLTVYGLRNWERVASMLVRKTAAQCRERWESYLDPHLHIREAWTAEEEEQLVQLQSLFPNQWNLIARELRRRGGMNRPAWLCEEHYHTLLDALEYERQQREGGSSRRNESLTLEDFLAERKRHRAYHQGHETREARSDAVNSDVFEKEMVEFAVSRLANQDGKKGLRKERKKQLQHTSFLAKLQSNREAIESGTLTTKAKKRMERAMLEDRAGPSGTRLQDGTREDDAESDSGDVAKDGAQRGQESAFRPIDLGADKQEAGIQAKQRVLVKNLVADKGRLQQETAVSEGINVDLLRIASGVSGSSVPHRLEGKKGIPPTASESSAAPGGSLGTAALDFLFASLPDTVAPKQSSVVEVSVPVNDLFGALPAPLLGSSMSRGGVATAKAEVIAAAPAEAEAVAEEEEEEAEEGPEVSYAVSSGSHSPAPSKALVFSSEEGQMWLRRAKRLVSVEAERAFLNHKRVRNDISSPTGTSQAATHARDENRTEAGEDVEEAGDDNESTSCIVRALVVQQLPATARDLLDAAGVLDEPLAKKLKLGNGYGGVCGGNADGAGTATEMNAGEEEVGARLAACVAAVQQESGAEFWKDVGATEATVQLEKRVHHQREQLEAAAAKDTAARRRLERIVRICFAGDGQHMRGDDFMYRARVYWGSKLEDAQRELAFYSNLREAERREIQRRLQEATSRLTDIEQKERTLQERYRSMRLTQ